MKAAEIFETIEGVFELLVLGFDAAQRHLKLVGIAAFQRAVGERILGLASLFCLETVFAAIRAFVTLDLSAL